MLLATSLVDDLLGRFGYAAVFGFVAIESIGIPVPGETMLIAAALYAGQQLASPRNPASGLVTAQHSQCARSGRDVATYLATGSPTTLGPQWSSSRSRILSQAKDAQPGLIRAQANAEITRCDHQLAQQAAAQATAQARPASPSPPGQASPSPPGADAAWLVRAQYSCRRVNGTWKSGRCTIDYRSPGDGLLRHYSVTLDARGFVIPPPNGPKTEEECAKHSQGSSGPPGHWHFETDICSI